MILSVTLKLIANRKTEPNDFKVVKTEIKPTQVFAELNKIDKEYPNYDRVDWSFQ